MKKLHAKKMKYLSYFSRTFPFLTKTPAPPLPPGPEPAFALKRILPWGSR